MPTKYKARNQAQIQTNSKGYLQIQIPGIYAMPLYGKKQKYIAFGAKADILKDLVGAAEVTEKLALLNKDLEDGVFNPSDIGKYKYSKKQIKHLYNSQQKQLSLLEVFDSFTSYRFSDPNDSGIYSYQKTFRPAVIASPYQDLSKSSYQRQIAEFIGQDRGYNTVVDVLPVLSRAVERAKLIGDLPENNPNVFLDCLSEYKSIKKKPVRPYPAFLVEMGFIKDNDKRAWTAEEVEIILSAWRNRYKREIYYRKCDVKTLLVEFLFRTGVRHGEAFGLKWNAVSDDMSEVLIHKSYSTAKQILKKTKNEKNRRLRLTQKATDILVRLEKFYKDIGFSVTPSSCVFMNENGKRFTSNVFAPIWRGTATNIGIVSQLLIDGKLNNYIDMYSTRRTYISLQAQSGVDPKTVANYVGDNVETILAHYYSGQEDFRPKDLF